MSKQSKRLHILDLAEVDKVRTNIPIFKQRRTDIYDTVEK